MHITQKKSGTKRKNVPIELIKQKEIRRGVSAFKIKSWPMLFVGIFLFLLLSYGGLLGYKIYLGGISDDLDAKINEISQSRDIPLEQKIEKLANQISRLNVILKKHFYWSNLFFDLEKLALTQAYFKTFDGEINANGEGILNMNIQVPDYSKAAAQIKLLEQDSYFKNVTIGSIGTDDDDGAVNFLASIIFDPTLLAGNKSE